nr:GDP-mannose 4,6-dehydratase [Candidatus Cloacimonadota bacterium]
MKKTILITGGAGFIGSNFVYHILDNTNYDIINFDALTYAGNLNNLKKIAGNFRYKFIKGDITNLDDLLQLKKEKFEFIINFAAESHVDRSIDSPNQFSITNILGTQNMLNLALEKNIEKFVQISTDEVYGSLGKTGYFTETTPLDPTSPYSASKTSADLIAFSYHKTFGIPLNITRCSNNYGPFQFPEKLIPLMINNALKQIELPVY